MALGAKSAPASAAASLYLTSTSSTVYLGQSFNIYPKVNTGGVSTNAYTVNMTFPGTIAPIAISKSGSICSLYTQAPSYTAATASINCGLPSPGYTGTAGGLGSVTFKAMSLGTATISISSSSKVLANDGLGTNILGSRVSKTITVVEAPPPPVSPAKITAEPDSGGKWVSTKSIKFNWSVPSGVTGSSFILTKDKDAHAPKNGFQNVITKSYSDLEDGTYYFRVLLTNGSQYSSEAEYVLKVDNTSPQDLVITSDPTNLEVIDVLPLISFSATDVSSGVAGYEIKIDDGEYVVAESPYQIQEISSGKHKVYVKAIDSAGNIVEDYIELNINEIPAPILISPVGGKYIPLGEKLRVEGLAGAGDLVYIYLEGELIGETTANEQGYFTYSHDGILPPGEYEITLSVKTTSGILGFPTEPSSFNVDSHAVRLGEYVLPSSYLLISSISILTLLILLVIYTLKRFRDYQNMVKSRADKAQIDVDRELTELELQIVTEMEAMLGKQGGKKIGKKVKEKLGKLIHDYIEEAEEDIDEVLTHIPDKKKKKTHKKKKTMKSKT